MSDNKHPNEIDKLIISDLSEKELLTEILKLI